MERLRRELIMKTFDTRQITDHDFRKLAAMLDAPASRGLDAMLLDRLGDILSGAIVVPAPDLMPDVAALESRLLFEDQGTAEQREISLVFPGEADPAQSTVSVLTPVGLGLLGCRAGSESEIQLPKGASRRIRLLRVSQPLAAARPIRS